MSYDLRIATHGRPDRAVVERIARDRRATVGGDEPLVVRRAKSDSGVEVWGPVASEADDLDDELAGAVLAPRWLTEITLPISAPKADLSLARALARGLAEACEGAAFDPQEDKLLWPPSAARRYRPPAQEERISVLNVTWVLLDWEAPDLPERWLRLVRRRLPEAAPVRYGEFEPLQERLEAGREDEFVRFWCDHVAAEASLGFFWSCNRPFYDGSFSAADQRARNWDGAGVLAAALRTDLDARALDAAPWREAVVDLFADLSEELVAAYAAAWIERDVLAGRRGLAYDDRSERFAEFSLLRHRWLGVPPLPTWLAWFGAPYRDRLAGVGEPVGRGVLLRVGEHPRPVDELAREYPQLPPEIVAPPGREGTAAWLPRA